MYMPKAMGAYAVRFRALRMPIFSYHGILLGKLIHCVLEDTDLA